MKPIIGRKLFLIGYNFALRRHNTKINSMMELNTPKKNWLPPCTTFENLNRPPMITDFDKVRKLGRGAYGQVFHVKLKNTEKEFAMKVITKQTIENLRMIDQLKNEFNILRKLNHPNIIKLNGFFEDERNIYFILELADEDHLYAKLNKVEKYDEPTAAKYMFEMFQACHYLHTQDPPIIHRDIKPENILFVKGSLKLADFGWSNMKDNKARTTYCGTPDYLAPEMVMDKPHNEKLDVWTLGVLLYELLVGKAPFTPSSSIKDKRQAQKELSKNIIDCKPKYPSFLSNTAVTFLSRLLKKDANSRPSCAEALQDPFFSNNGLKWEAPAKYDLSQTKPATPKDSTASKSNKYVEQISESIAASTPKSGSAPKFSTESAGMSPAAVIEMLVGKLPSNLSVHYGKDQNKFLKELIRSWIELKAGEEDMLVSLNSKNKTCEELSNKINTIPKSPEGSKLSQADVDLLYKEAKDAKTKISELNEIISKADKEKEALFKKCADLEKKCLDLTAERDELLMEKRRVARQFEDLQSSQIFLQDDWEKEKSDLNKKKEQMEEILSNNPQTRPALIQSSLLRITAVMEEINDYYLTQVKGQAKDGESSKPITTDVRLLQADKRRLEARIKELEAEVESRVKLAQDTAELEGQATLRQCMEEYNIKREKEFETLEKQLQESKKISAQVSILTDQIENLKAQIADKDKLLSVKNQKELALSRKVQEKVTEMNDMENTITGMIKQIQELKADKVR